MDAVGESGVAREGGEIIGASTDRAPPPRRTAGQQDENDGGSDGATRPGDAQLHLRPPRAFFSGGETAPQGSIEAAIGGDATAILGVACEMRLDVGMAITIELAVQIGAELPQARALVAGAHFTLRSRGAAAGSSTS